ncbi:MAG: DUF177 domain-containing protein [Gammaproteobacteria bacterium]|nr:DUF177 domain-containing protein [Gammaproteobacteria bacterium]
MSGRLPETVQWDRLTEGGETLRGTIALQGMTRLAGCLLDDEGEVDVELESGIDAQKVRYLRGHLRTTLNLVCQRCLQPLSYPLDIDISLGLVLTDDEAERLPEVYDPYVFDQRTAELMTILEDELMLALPLVPMHDTARCRIDPAYAVVEEPVQPVDTGTRRPFARLDALMKGKAG